MKPYFEKGRENKQVVDIKRLRNEELDEPLHFHSNLELVYILDGSATATVNGQDYMLQTGDMLFTMGYEIHGYANCRGDAYCLIVPEVMLKSFKSLLGSNGFASRVLPKGEYSDEIEDMMHRLMSTTHQLRMKGYVYVILGLLMEHADIVENKSTIHERHVIQQMLEYIDQNYLNDIKIADIAKALGYNSSYLSTVFNSCFKTTFNDYLNSVRIRHAVYLFSQNYKDILEVAFASGFNSLRTFNRAFQKVYNMSPSEYLRQKDNT
ncbi:MAG: AraC family transcriptional regulator [Clostridia bacterium]|nr:AraC family transcriptional regulator [Clostridia bacterium]